MIRKVCIFTKGDSDSKLSAKKCIESGKRQGINNIELFPGVHFKEEMYKVHRDHDLKLRYTPVSGNKTDFEKKTAPATRIANGTTHYLLYKWSAENNKPIIIIEHDSFFVSPLPKIDTDKYANAMIQISSHAKTQMTPELLYGCRRAQRMRQYELNSSYDWKWNQTSLDIIIHPISGMNGTSGYYVGPKAAQRMIDYIHQSGIAFADRIRKDHIGHENLFLQVPQSMFCHNDVRSTRLI